MCGAPRWLLFPFIVCAMVVFLFWWEDTSRVYSAIFWLLVSKLLERQEPGSVGLGVAKWRAVALSGQTEARRFAEDATAKCCSGHADVEQLTRMEKDILFSRMVYDDRRRIVLCCLTWVQCSNWKAVLNAFTSGSPSWPLPRQPHLHSPPPYKHINFLSGLADADALRRLQAYKKIILVRNPDDPLWTY
eukprot:scpid76713/ scgid25120/ 